MSGRPKDRAISEDEYRRKEADAMQRTADQNRALQSIFGRLRALASDWEANSGSRGLGERSEATAWSKAASQLREAISPSEPQAEPSSEVPEPRAWHDVAAFLERRGLADGGIADFIRENAPEPQSEPSNRVIVMCARCGLFPVVGGDEINSDIVVCDRCAFAEGRESAQGEPSDARAKVIDALVMTRLSDFAGTDMGVIEQAADAVLAALRAAGVGGAQ